MNFSHTIDAVKSRFPNAELDTRDADSGIYSFLNIRLENGNSADIERREPLEKFGFSLIASSIVTFKWLLSLFSFAIIGGASSLGA